MQQKLILVLNFSGTLSVMDWKLAIEKNTDGLAAVIAGLFWLIKWSPGRNKPATLPRATYLHLAASLRTAASALRRIIVLYMKVYKISATPRPPATAQPLPNFEGFNTALERAPAFQLMDARKPIILFDEADWHSAQMADGAHEAPSSPFSQTDCIRETPDQGDVPADGIISQLAALDHALNHIPQQARRLARIIARQNAAPFDPVRGRAPGPIRIGKPPGHRDRPLFEVDFILTEIHGLNCDFDANPP